MFFFVAIASGVVLIIVTWKMPGKPSTRMWAILLVSTAWAATVKTLNLILWDSTGSGVRQIVIVVTLGVVVMVALRMKPSRRWLTVCGVLPTPSGPRQEVEPDGPRHVVLGALAVAAVAAAMVVPKRDWWLVGAWALLVAGLATFIAFVAWEIRRESSYRAKPTSPQPALDVMWSIALPMVALSAAALASLVLMRPTDLDKVGPNLIELLLVTVAGEELVFRGFLLALALGATRPGRLAHYPRSATSPDPGALGDRTILAYWVVSVGFALWHVGDAYIDVRSHSSSGWFAFLSFMMVLTVTGLASRFVLIPLRIRTGTIAAPALAHVAANAPGIVLG